MPEIYCRKCGTIVRPTDLFCRRCGSPLDSATVAEEGTQDAKPEQGREGLVGSEVRSSLKSPGSKRTTYLIAAAGLLFLGLALVMVFFISQAIARGGPAIAIELVGTSTPYPTRTPYRTATPYRTPTPYPTVVPYPTTGALAAVAPTASASDHTYNPVVPIRPLYDGWCELSVRNQNTDRDSVIILATVDTNSIVASMYVRANDSFSESEISTGSYYIYVTLGQDLDALTGRFINYAEYFRFKDLVVFDACSNLAFGDQQSIDITLNVTEGSGSDTINVQPDSFPRLSP